MPKPEELFSAAKAGDLEAPGASEENFRNPAAEISDGLVIVSAGRIAWINQAVEILSGSSRDELSGQPVEKLFPPAEAALLRQRLADRIAEPVEERVSFETVQRTKDGRLVPVEVTGYYVAHGGQEYNCAFVRNIGERRRRELEEKKLQKRMLEAQKLESLSILAGGIAHDFNNLLMGVLGNASLALMDLPSDSPARASLRQIENAARRAAELTNQLLAYSGRSRFVVQPLHLSRLVEEMANLLKISVSEKALSYRLDQTLPPVEGEPTQLQQVIMNLIANASDALGDTDGAITVATGVLDADADYLSGVYLGEALPSGRYAYLEVSDTGCGMDEATLARIFDPFFTTKFAGRGLGLAAVLGIVRGHKGGIRVVSAPGQGSAFRILLPCSERTAEAQAAQAGGTADWRGQGTILVVDDEEGVRMIVNMILAEYGFSVLTAADGRQAIDLLRAAPQDITAVILDLTMPRLSGLQTFRELRKIKPDVRVILSSGYSEQESVGLFTDEGLAGFIQKPYNVTTLTEKLRAILEA